MRALYLDNRNNGKTLLGHDVIEAACAYLKRGWKVIPIEKLSKKPTTKDWPNLNIREEEVDLYFNEGKNIGVILGKPSGGLVDVDIDYPPAYEVADYFLPKTGAIFGRKSKPRSHWIYYCPDAETTKFSFKGQMLVEIRSTGAQTIFPPSIHPSEEPIEWEEASEAAHVEMEELKRGVAKLASCALLSIYYPTEGSRQYAAMALAGYLLRRGWSEDETRGFLEALCKLARDEETRMRLTQIRYTATKIDRDLPTTGFPTLSQYYPEDVLQKVAEWLGLKTEKPKTKQIVVLDKFYPRPFTERLIARYQFWWPGGKEPLYWYDPEEGIWRDDGEELIIHELRTAVEELPDVQKRRYVIDEIIADVKGVCWKGKPLPEPPLHLIPLQNGVFDLETGEVREYRPEDFFTAKLPWRYNPKAQSKLVIPLIESILPQEETITLYELMAYCLFRDYPYQKFFLLFGRGSNGKSLFAKILERFLGKENVASVTLREFQHDRFAASRLYRKLGNICSELEYEDIERTGLLKQLCGGDMVEADRKFREPIKFRNYAKLIFLTNEVPRSTDTTEAFYRRLFLIEFPKKFKEDPELEVRVTTAEAEEYEALLLKVLEVLKALKDRGFVFSRHKSIEETRELYLKLSSPLHTFIEENCEITYQSDDYIYKYEFKERFGQWLKEKGRTAYTDQRLKKEMQSLGIEEARKGADSWWAWVGLKWKDTPSKPSRPSGFYNRYIAGENRFENHDGSDGLDGTPSKPHSTIEEEVVDPTPFENRTTKANPSTFEFSDLLPEEVSQSEESLFTQPTTPTQNTTTIEEELTDWLMETSEEEERETTSLSDSPAEETPLPCSVCTHPKRSEIEYLYDSMVSPKRLSKKYRIDVGVIKTHMEVHRKSTPPPV